MSGKVALTPANSSQERMKACAAQWDKLKAEGRTNNQTYQQYSASCLKSWLARGVERRRVERKPSRLTPCSSRWIIAATAHHRLGDRREFSPVRVQLTDAEVRFTLTSTLCGW